MDTGKQLNNTGSYFLYVERLSYYKETVACIAKMHKSVVSYGKIDKLRVQRQFTKCHINKCLLEIRSIKSF